MEKIEVTRHEALDAAKAVLDELIKYTQAGNYADRENDLSMALYHLKTIGPVWAAESD